jgi:undecaprenyl-diphosphatase
VIPTRLRPYLKTTSAVLLVGVLALLTFLELAEDVWTQEGFVWDAPLMLAIHHFSQPWLDKLFVGITYTAAELVFLPLLAVAGWLAWQKKWHLLLSLLVSFGGAMGMSFLFKSLFARPRPTVFVPLLTENSFIFTSGHTLLAVAVFGWLAVWLWQCRQTGWAILSGVWVFLVALSRVYLGVHYPSDVLASLMLGTVWLVFVLFWFGSGVFRGGKMPAFTPPT